MSRVEFTAYYDGEALREGRMDVRDLAPALLAFGDLLEEANRVLNQDRAKIAVNVRAFTDGSFGVDLEVVQGFAQHIVNILNSGEVTAAINLMEILGLGGAVFVGLTTLIKRSKGRHPTSLRRIERGNVVFEFEGIDAIEVPVQVAELYKDLKVRSALEKTVAPIKKEGIESFEISMGNTRSVIAAKSEVDYFATPNTDVTALMDQEEERFFSIVSLSFKERNKWRLNDGTSVVSVLVSDKDFLGRVDRNEVSFAKGDLLKIRIRITQHSTAEGLKTTYEAVRVLEHKKAGPPQLELPITGG